MPRGEKNKLTEQQRQDIYDLKGKVSAYKLAAKYKVTHTTIYKIWKRQPPTSYRGALHAIRVELEKARGFPMDPTVFQMWCNISTVVNHTLENTP